MPFLGPEAGCPAQFAACLDRDGGLVLERNINALRQYAAEAEIRCYEAVDGGH